MPAFRRECHPATLVELTDLYRLPVFNPERYLKEHLLTVQFET